MSHRRVITSAQHLPGLLAVKITVGICQERGPTVFGPFYPIQHLTNLLLCAAPCSARRGRCGAARGEESAAAGAHSAPAARLRGAVDARLHPAVRRATDAYEQTSSCRHAGMSSHGSLAAPSWASLRACLEQPSLYSEIACYRAPIIGLPSLGAVTDRMDVIADVVLIRNACHN